MNKLLIPIASVLLFSSCREKGNTVSVSAPHEGTDWTFEKLSLRADRHLDSTQWDSRLLEQDIANYEAYTELFNNFPLNKSPFPVATYDYAVSSIPFTIETEGAVFKGVRIGAYETPESENSIDKLTLLVLTNDKAAEENTLVESRNYPYLTAQGTFYVQHNALDWVFAASPDGFSTLMVNMKLFDLRFGETIVIYPQKDRSFRYTQIKDSPSKYKDFAVFKKKILDTPKVKNQLESRGNIN